MGDGEEGAFQLLSITFSAGTARVTLRIDVRSVKLSSCIKSYGTRPSRWLTRWVYVHLRTLSNHAVARH